MRKIIFAAVLGFVFSLGAYSAAEAGNHSCEPNGQCGVWVEDRETYDRICLTMGWISCGEWTIYDASGAVINRLVGPAPLSAFIVYARCQTSNINLCGDSSSVPLGSAVQTGTFPRLVFVPDTPPTPWIPIPDPSAPQPTATAAPQPTAEPTQSAPQPTATAVPQPTAGPTQSAPQPTATAAPTNSLTAVTVASAVSFVPVSTVDPVDPSVILNTYENNLTYTDDGDINWSPKPPKFGEMIAI